MNTEHEQAINESGRERLSEGIKWHKGQLSSWSVLAELGMKMLHTSFCGISAEGSIAACK